MALHKFEQWIKITQNMFLEEISITKNLSKCSTVDKSPSIAIVDIFVPIFRGSCKTLVLKNLPYQHKLGVRGVSLFVQSPWFWTVHNWDHMSDDDDDFEKLVGITSTGFFVL